MINVFLLYFRYSHNFRSVSCIYDRATKIMNNFLFSLALLLILPEMYMSVALPKLREPSVTNISWLENHAAHRMRRRLRGRRRRKERREKRNKREERTCWRRVSSGSPWTTRREDPSITHVPHLSPVARTCRTSSPLQRRRRGSRVLILYLDRPKVSLASCKKCVIIRGHCASPDVKKTVCACSQSHLCIMSVRKSAGLCEYWQMASVCSLRNSINIVNMHSKDFVVKDIVRNIVRHLIIFIAILNL